VFIFIKQIKIELEQSFQALSIETNMKWKNEKKKEFI
jgi:hypothetical protein